MAFSDGTLSEIERAKERLCHWIACESALDTLERAVVQIGTAEPELSIQPLAEPMLDVPAFVETDANTEPPEQIKVEESVASEPVCPAEEPPVVAPPVVVARAPQANRSERRKFDEQVRLFTSEMDQITEPISPWQSRRLVCWVRALLRLCERHDCVVPFLHDALAELKQMHNRATETSPFFGLNNGRSLHESVWMDFKLAYEAGGLAFEWAQQAVTPFDAETGELFEHARSVRDLLEALLEAHIQGPDSVVKDLREILRGLGSATSAPLPSDHAKAMERLRAQANDFMLLHKRHFELRGKRVRREQALAELESYLGTADAEFELGDRIAELAQECLDSGVPASHTHLRKLLVPYRALLEEAGRKPLAKLIEYLAKDEAKAVVEATRAEETDEAVDPDHDRRVKELRELLAGKRLFIVGGNKGQRQRASDWEQLLGVEIDWPDAEVDTKVARLLPSVKKADFVAQLIRFSRHSYGELLKAARTEGKPVIRVTSGLGTRKVVYDLYHQLVRAEG